MEKENRPNAPLPEPGQYGWSKSSLPQQVLRNRPSGGAIPRHPPSTRAASMEGAVLYQKRTDNSGVRYRHDPRDRDAMRRQISWGLFVVFLLVVWFAPRLWVRHLGYREAQLTESIAQLALVRDQLKVERGRLQDRRLIAARAETEGLQETDEGSYTWFAPRPVDSGSKTAVALLIDRKE